MNRLRGRNIIGKGTWLDKVAYQVIQREKSLGRDTSNIRVESGLGASGIPHVGSLSDAVRAYGVKMALEEAGYKSDLIAFSDDLDGLRKVPAGLPDELGKYICRPVSRIPDPFGCHDSYGAHMSSILTDALDQLSIPYIFRSASRVYAEGLLTRQIARILQRADEIGRSIQAMTGQDKFTEALPYFPICGSCGRLYVASSRGFHEETMKVSYKCSGSMIAGRWTEGCGYEGEARIDRDEGKLSWKVEFAARWSAQDIRFEAYGKDIADSVKINDWVSDNILDFPHPSHVRYELFLDKSGRKISKSVGNVFTPQTWLRYGSPQSLILLMFKRIAGTRNLSPSDIPTYMDDYDNLEDIYFGKVKLQNPMKELQLRGLYEFINHRRPASEPDQHVPYNLLVQLARHAPKGDDIYVSKKLLQYNLTTQVSPSLKKRIRYALNWAEDFQEPTKIDLKLTDKEKRGLRELADLIMKNDDAAAIQSGIFEVARGNGFDPGEFFKLVYRVLIGADRGPRLGAYIVDIGREKARDRILSVL